MNSKVFKINDCGVLEFCADYASSVITIPYGVKAIGNEVFEGRKNLERVIIPESVKTIGDWSFFCCENLHSAGIPKGVTKIGKGAYAECCNLRTVLLPDSVIEIGERAFINCPNLVSISIPDSVKIIGENVFDNCITLDICYEGTKEQWNALTKGINLGRVDNVRYHFNANKVNCREGVKHRYEVDVTNGVCRKVPIEMYENCYNYVPIDMTKEMGTNDYTVLVDGDSLCSLRTKFLNIDSKKPIIWVDKLLALAKKYKRHDPNGDITVQVIVEDTGNNTIEATCLVECDLDSIDIFSGNAEDFFYNKKVSSEWEWLPSYIKKVLQFYNWVDIACIDLLLAVDPSRYSPDKCTLLRGITTAKGLFKNMSDDYCDDGEYAISSIVCLKD